MLKYRIGEFPMKRPAADKDGPVDAGQAFRVLLVRISKPFCQLATSTISNDGDTSGTGDVGSGLNVLGAAMHRLSIASAALNAAATLLRPTSRMLRAPA